eukprot:TRINITY_DN4134_c0_g1_i1.p1 TRINITY_DN4134_c0_g1~~TRINITY_DN4134_c0_g1_i1.p1  ORF type:complete len:415 (-),score=71.07 TRINITY_DN4134_c0_g1_i1:253-1497(-)
MLHSLFILNSSGEVLIEKHWQGIVTRTVSEYFWDHVSKSSAAREVLPVIVHPRYYLVHLQNSGLYYLGVTPQETPPLLILEFLQRIVDIFTEYFTATNEETLKDNFVTVYQLLDEVMDGGFPFTTEPNILMEMINPTDFIKRITSTISGSSSIAAQLPNGSLSNIPWRKQGVKYTANEIYFDIYEDINCIIDPNGMQVMNEVSGYIQCSCHLSGMPDLTLIFSNPRIIDDVSFHPCVRYNRWEKEKVISFVPPDGNFRLMSFRVNQINQLPLYVKPQIVFGSGGGKVTVTVGNKQLTDKTIEDVIISIPLPKSSTSNNFTADLGSVTVDEITKVCKWNIGRLTKDKSCILTGSLNLAPGSGIPECNPVLQVDFRVSMFTIIGLKIETLALYNESYKPFKGVRNITKAGSFQVRS